MVPGKPTEHEIATIERIAELYRATVGLAISEGKAILAGLQQQMVTAQVQHHGVSIHRCEGCGRACSTKGYYHTTLRSVYGKVGMAKPARHDWSTSSRAHCLCLLRFETGCNKVSGKPHRRTAERVVRLKAFRCVVK